MHPRPDTANQIKSAIKDSLRNPTKQMRVTFEKLPSAYKWFLVAVLELPDAEESYSVRLRGNVANLRNLYEAYCPDADHQPFETIMEHLTEAFVKVRETDFGGTVVDWIHPSYRDLVIEELIKNAELRNTFLRRASLEGVKLAVSDTGGRYGARSLPFIRSAESWDVLKDRCLSMVASDIGDAEASPADGGASVSSHAYSLGGQSVTVPVGIPVDAKPGKWKITKVYFQANSGGIRKDLTPKGDLSFEVMPNQSLDLPSEATVEIQ